MQISLGFVQVFFLRAQIFRFFVLESFFRVQELLLPVHGFSFQEQEGLSRCHAFWFCLHA